IAAREPDSSFTVLELTAERCTMRFRRPSRGIDAEYTYEFGDAKRAGLTKPGSNWEKFPKDMLRWACMKRLARAYASDLSNGLGGGVEVAAVAGLLEEAGDEHDIIDGDADGDHLYNPGDEPPRACIDCGEVLGEDEHRCEAVAASPAREEQPARQQAF